MALFISIKNSIFFKTTHTKDACQTYWIAVDEGWG